MADAWKTVVTRDQEFDPIEQDSWAAWDEYQAALCPQCHRLRSICENPDQDFFAQKHQCWQSAATAVANRRWNKMNEKAEPDRAGYLATDGVIVWANAEGPDDDFLDPPRPGVPGTLLPPDLVALGHGGDDAERDSSQ